MANPRNEKQSNIDKEKLVTLLRCGLTRQQICDFYHISPFTLNSYCKREFGKTFEETKAESSAFVKANIMSNLLNLSKKNASVAIFLAKSVCGLSETVSAPPNDDAGTAFTTALKQASRSISGMSGLALVPSQGEPDSGEEDDD